MVGFFVLILTLFSSIRCLIRPKSSTGWDLVLMFLVFLLDGEAARSLCWSGQKRPGGQPTSRGAVSGWFYLKASKCFG